MQQVLLNKLRHHSMQNSGLSSDMDMEDVIKSRSKIPTIDPFKILLHTSGSSKIATLPAIKACESRDFEKTKLQTTSSIDSGVVDAFTTSERAVSTKNQDSEKDPEENQTDIKLSPLKSNDIKRHDITNEHCQIKDDANSTAIRSDKPIGQDPKLASKLTGSGKDIISLSNKRENVAETDKTPNEKFTSVIDAAVLLESADKIGLQLERTKTLLSELDRQSEPADLQADLDGPQAALREVHSARADLNLSHQRPRNLATSKEQMQVEARRMKEAVVLTIAKELCEERARNRLNKDLVSAEVALYDSPSYRDWETSDRSLKYLEERIARFYVETDKDAPGKIRKSPPLLPKLRRFEPTVSHA